MCLKPLDQLLAALAAPGMVDVVVTAVLLCFGEALWLKFLIHSQLLRHVSFVIFAAKLLNFQD